MSQTEQQQEQKEQEEIINIASDIEKTIEKYKEIIDQKLNERKEIEKKLERVVNGWRNVTNLLRGWEYKYTVFALDSTRIRVYFHAPYEINIDVQPNTTVNQIREMIKKELINHYFTYQIIETAEVFRDITEAVASKIASDITNEIMELDKKVSGLDAKVYQIKKKVEELSEIKRELKEEIEELEERKAELLDEIENLENRRADLAKEVEKLQEEQQQEQQQ